MTTDFIQVTTNLQERTETEDIVDFVVPNEFGSLKCKRFIGKVVSVIKGVYNIYL